MKNKCYKSMPPLWNLIVCNSIYAIKCKNRKENAKKGDREKKPFSSSTLKIINDFFPLSETHNNDNNNNDDVDISVRRIHRLGYG